LIKVVNSCISAGTEMSSINVSGKGVIKRALEQPEKVKKVINTAKSDGIARAYKKLKGELEKVSQTGYSLSGVVIGIGEGVSNFEIGDKVAATGGGVASHAEYVDVPVNLAVKIPGEVDFLKASSVALGSIAMQGVRRADLKLGEFGVVVGTGILGLLTIQMLKISGIRVVAMDIDEERLNIAKELGAEIIINPTKENQVKIVTDWASGFGADAVIFTASTESSEPLSKSFQMCKKKGRVVIVGVSGMTIDRKDIYSKEIDFLISTSYGPGRYDKKYEEKNYDYPYAYVRWTENRNMNEYLRLLNNGSINLDKLISKVYPINRVTEAFESLKKTKRKSLMVILDYGEPNFEKFKEYKNHIRKVIIKNNPIKKDVVNIAIIGVGSFATGMHLPNIQKLKKKYKLYAVMNRTGYKAKTVAEQYGANYATTNYDDILHDENVSLVLICTRHDSHAELTLKALKAGKNVFVEKPLATNQKELDKIKEFYEDKNIKNKPVLFVGFNRRFSKYAKEIKKHTDKRLNPLFIHYRMNAGFIPLDHWVHENDGRIVGEACHIIDLMTFFTGAKIKSISYESITPQNESISSSDNKSIILKYQDGSVATLDYFAVGSKDFPKEYMEIYFDEKTIVMNNYQHLKGYGLNIKEIKTKISDKGHLEELKRLYEALKGDNPDWPIEFWDMVQTTEITLLISDT
nr:bi-domain-containing oxidoreductase [Bacteroidota bacterium]